VVNELSVSRVYSDEYVSLFHGDSNAAFDSQDACDLLIMDPPFDMWHKVDKAPKANTVAAFTNMNSRRHVEDVFGRPRAELVWVFGEGRWVSKTLPRITHETILVFGRTGDALVGERVVDRKNVSKGHSSIGRWVGEERRIYKPGERKMLNSHLSFPRRMASGFTSWAKPEEVMDRLIEWLCPVGGLVIDPYCGSGTTLVSCRKLGRTAIGCEISSKMVGIAVERLSKMEHARHENTSVAAQGRPEPEGRVEREGPGFSEG
jgi:site-specific DNA-methyltransferase (adenine-specific)